MFKEFTNNAIWSTIPSFKNALFNSNCSARWTNLVTRGRLQAQHSINPSSNVLEKLRSDSSSQALTGDAKSLIISAPANGECTDEEIRDHEGPIEAY